MDLALLTVIGIVAVALLFDYINGFHDSANSISTIVAIRGRRTRMAVLWAAFFNFIAFAFFGTKAPQQLKRLLDTVVEQILVESRACIQPYFVAPTVRTRPGSRRRTGTHTNPGIPSPSLWVTTQAWGRVS